MHSALRVARRRRGESAPRTGDDVVDAIWQLALICTDDVIASYLNRNGMLTAKGNRWGRMAITSLRGDRRVPVFSAERQQAEGWIKLTEAAAHVGVAARTMRRLVEAGKVKALHPLDDGPWVFKRADLDASDFRQRLEQRLAASSKAAGPDSRQLTLAISTTYRGEVL